MSAGLPQLDLGKCRVALGDADTPGFVLLTIALWTFRDRLFGDPEIDLDPMDPAEIWAEFNEIFGTWVTEEGENKLNALMLAIRSPAFYEDVETFCAVSNALFDGDLGDMVNGIFEEPTVTEMLWATLEVELARDDDDVAPPFSRRVSEFLSRKLAEEQEDHSEQQAAVDEVYVDMMEQLRDIGVPLSAIRILNAEYAEVVEAMDNMRDAIPTSSVP